MYRCGWQSTCTFVLESAVFIIKRYQWYQIQLCMLIILVFFFYRGGNFNKDYDRKMVTKVWLDSAGVAFIFWVFCRNIVHFFERFDIHVVCNSCSGMQKWNYQLEEKEILISVLTNKKDFMVHVCKE